MPESHDGRPAGWVIPEERRVHLVLYVSLSSAASLRARTHLEQVLARFDPSQVSVEIRDVARHPEQAEADHIIFTPTLIKTRPEPRAWFVGDLPDPALTTALLASCGVNRNP